VHLESTVYNPFDADLPIRIHVNDVPYGWAIVTDPPQFVIPPRGKHPVHVTVYPSGLPAHEIDGSPSSPQSRDCPPNVKWDPKQLRESLQIGFIGKPKVEAQMPFYDTYIPIGGIDVWTQLVRETQLTCRVAGTKQVIDRNLERAIRDALQPPQPSAPPKARLQGQERPSGLDPTKVHTLFPLVQRPQPDPVVPRGRVTIEGQLKPAISGAVIAIEVTRNGKRRVQFVKTDANGTYRFTTSGDAAGRTVVQASFAGDREHGESESGFCAFRMR